MHINLGLERIQTVVDRLQLQHFSCPVITVAGTNGKGSTIEMLSQLYLQNGYSVCAYTSPHVHAINERFAINGQHVDSHTLQTALHTVADATDDLSLTFFETATAVALLLFQQKKPDVVLLEVGLGGRLDAVNVIDPDVSVITSIGIDHCEYLGDNREDIAREKAGILRANTPVVFGEIDRPECIDVYAAQHSAPLFAYGRDFYIEIEHNTFTYHGEQRIEHLPLPALKFSNVATALKVVECLHSRLPVKPPSMVQAIQTAQLPGRFECFSRGCLCILDVAHNPDSARYLLAQLNARPCAGKRVAVVAMLDDKDIAGTVQPLLPSIDTWYAASLDEERGADAVKISQALTTHGIKNWYTFATVEQAVQKALAACQPNDQLVVFGSFHTVARARLLMLQKETT